MCKFFERFWDSTERLQVRALNFPHRQQSVFPRIEAWQKKRPPTGGLPCRCGCSDDSFKCYLRVQSRELMGESRRIDGTTLIRDFEIVDREIEDK
jgi:hypothetical protein